MNGKDNSYQFTKKSVLIRNQFYLPKAKKWKFASSVNYSEYLDREEAKTLPGFTSYSKYFGERPGSLGLRDINHQKIDLSKPNIIPKIHEKSPVWEAVVSLDENLSLLVKPAYLERAIDIFTKEFENTKKYKLDINKMHFEYAIHVNTNHTHAHLKWYYKEEYDEVVKKGKKYKTVTKKVKAKDIRKTGQLNQNFINSIKQKITEDLIWQVYQNGKYKINYEDKIKMLSLFKIKFQNELVNESMSKDIYHLIKHFKNLVPTSYRYSYLTKDQKLIIDNIYNKFMLKNSYFLEFEKSFLKEVQTHYEKLINVNDNEFLKFKDVIKAKVKNEHTLIEKELKNVILKSIKNWKEQENQKSGENQETGGNQEIAEQKEKIVDYAFSNCESVFSSYAPEQYKNHRKLILNKIFSDINKLLLPNHKLDSAIREQVWNIKKLIEKEEKTRGM